MECLRESDIVELTRQPLAAFDQRVSEIPADLCAPFHDEARTLETELLSVYRFVAHLSKRLEDLAHVSALWGAVVIVCDAFGSRLKKLAEAHPACGAEIYYDRVLDLRNKCRRLQEMHS
jgi:hypothetical protein